MEDKVQVSNVREVNFTEVQDVFLKAYKGLTKIYNLQLKENQKIYRRQRQYRINVQNPDRILNNLPFSSSSLLSMQFNRQDIKTMLLLYESLPVRYKIVKQEQKIEKTWDTHHDTVNLEIIQFSYNATLEYFLSNFAFSFRSNELPQNVFISKDIMIKIKPSIFKGAHSRFNIEAYYITNTHRKELIIDATINNDASVSGRNIINNINNFGKLEELKTLIDYIKNPSHILIAKSVKMNQKMQKDEFNKIILEQFGQMYGNYYTNLLEFGKKIIDVVLLYQKYLINKSIRIILNNPATLQKWKKFYIFNSNIASFFLYSKFNLIRDLYKKTISFKHIKYKIIPSIQNNTTIGIDQIKNGSIKINIKIKVIVYIDISNITENYDKLITEKIETLTGLWVMHNDKSAFTLEQSNGKTYCRIPVYLGNIEINLLDYIDKNNKINWDEIKKTIMQETDYLIRQRLIFNNSIPLMSGLKLDYSDLLDYANNQIMLQNKNTINRSAL